MKRCYVIKTEAMGEQSLVSEYGHTSLKFPTRREAVRYLETHTADLAGQSPIVISSNELPAHLVPLLETIPDKDAQASLNALRAKTARLRAQT